MKKSLTQNILEALLIEGGSVLDKKIAIKIDHTLKGMDRMVTGKWINMSLLECWLRP